ncbi:NAD(P)H-quinone oxidoreductase subunit L, chloroplastic [Corylus avellana]|uniref:NAD(P)H-quinone oxidoreductase subunit L, chloroplastic n=1 Tax=Corylus avellana TaxID=13451 RepID=UPI001E1FD176|nr:NAD(P)H-quinone oxidoreductase subunit L, chloroplastic [Corylus avellana]
MSFQITKALPPLSPSHCKLPSPLITATNKHKPSHNAKPKKTLACISQKPFHEFFLKKATLAIQAAALLATVEQPALAVTGVNNEEDLASVLIQLGIVAFGYLIIMPPIILNWLRIRWYRRNLLEMYFQFMFVFIFFPGILVWAPFLNFRKFPRDPSMKYPWSTPQDPSKIKNGYLKYPYAEPEDYA